MIWNKSLEVSVIEQFIWVVNLIGTVAFAASGALTGMKKGMDLFGVCMLGLVTAVGGGVIRDLILGLTPPMAFQDPTSALVALGVSAVFILSRVREPLMYAPALFILRLFWMDSLGLGAFTVVGVQLAYESVAEPTMFLVVFVAVVTGVGGGVLRDQLAGDTPYIFVKHVYASASLAGALLCAGLWPWTGNVTAMLAGLAVVVLIRGLAAHFRWNLPRAKV